MVQYTMTYVVAGDINRKISRIPTPSFSKSFLSPHDHSALLVPLLTEMYDNFPTAFGFFWTSIDTLTKSNDLSSCFNPWILPPKHISDNALITVDPVPTMFECAVATYGPRSPMPSNTALDPNSRIQVVSSLVLAVLYVCSSRKTSENTLFSTYNPCYDHLLHNLSRQNVHQIPSIASLPGPDLYVIY